jgi:hypothetical protein
MQTGFGTAPAMTTPTITIQPGGPTIYNFVPNGTAATPSAPATGVPPGFGVVGSPTPGMIQVPQPVAPPPGPNGVQIITRPPGQ